jgi:hypothetical protein
MKRLIAIAGLLSLAAGALAAVQLSSTPFKILMERDIFDANRRIPPTMPPQVRVDFFALKGVMTYEKTHYAFFVGYGVGNFQGARQTGDVIKGCRIVEITREGVKLADNHGQVFALSVGGQMSRTEGATWTLVATTLDGVKQRMAERRKLELQQP